MNPADAPHLVDECRTIEENCLYTAAAHHQIAADTERWVRWLKLVPAAIAAISGWAVLAGYTAQIGWFSILSGLATAMAVALDVDKRWRDHQDAARQFTVLRHDARSTHQTFAFEMERDDFAPAVKRLAERYNELVSRAPPTTEKAFEKGRKKVIAGIYAPDFIEAAKRPNATHQERA